MDLPKRKPTRLKDYDYSSPGAYFITICTKDRKQLLSSIIVGDDALIVPKNNLSKIGRVCDKYINSINIKYENVTVDKYVIMPNHIHLIVFFARDDVGIVPYKEHRKYCSFVQNNGYKGNWQFYMAKVISRPYNTRRKRLSENMGIY